MNLPSTNRERDPQTYTLIGVAMAVHAELGHGFLESVYQEAFELELKHRQIPYAREMHLPIHYKGQRLHTFFKADFVCYQAIVVELKALKRLTALEESQMINYLKATGHHRALLFNFGSQSLEHKRFILNPQMDTELH